jgi:hypothetical protein
LKLVVLLDFVCRSLIGAASLLRQTHLDVPTCCFCMRLRNCSQTDRARAAKRAGEKGKPAKEKDGLTAAQRKERDAKALQEKQAKKAATGN